MEKKGHQYSIKGLSVRCLGKEGKWIVQILQGLLYIYIYIYFIYLYLLTKHCPESYIIDIEIMLKLRLTNSRVCYIKAYRL